MTGRAGGGDVRGAADRRAAGFRRRSGLAVITVTAPAGTQAYEVTPALWISGALVGVLLTLGTIAAAGYMAFHDDIIETAFSRQIRMEQAYEDRIAGLRAEIDRINSRQLLDQDAFEARIDKLMSRQDELRSQDARVVALVDKARQQGMHVAAPAEADANLAAAPMPLLPPVASPSFAAPVDNPPLPARPAPATRAPQGPHPIDDMPLRSSFLEASPPALATPVIRPATRRSDQSPALRIAGIEAALDQMAVAQVKTIAEVTGLAERNSHVIESVVGKLGLRMAETDLPPTPRAKPALAPDRPGVGGPLVPVGDPTQILARAESALNRLGQLKRSVGLLPLGQPVRGAVEVTSSFGERPDPFLGVMAMHTGIDFRAAYGDPVVATGAGTVTEAGRQGGYGNLVEIDHGNGIATRYGHLSGFNVSVGQKVKAGQVIAFAGSTGRSTAPHLHYETRIGNEAVNPTSYLEAGNRLRPLLN